MLCGLGFKVWGVGFEIEVWGAGCRVESFEAPNIRLIMASL